MNEKTIELLCDFVRKHTNISTNMQDKFLGTAVRETIDIDVTETLGSALTKKMCEIIEANNTEDEMFTKLINYAKYYISYSTIARLVVISSIKLDNIGANKTSDDKVEPLDTDDVFAMESFYYNKADVYKKKLQKYILANKTYFSEWLKCSIYDENPQLYSSSTCNIFLGGDRGKTNIKKFKVNI